MFKHLDILPKKDAQWLGLSMDATTISVLYTTMVLEKEICVDRVRVVVVVKERLFNVKLPSGTSFWRIFSSGGKRMLQTEDSSVESLQLITTRYQGTKTFSIRSNYISLIDNQLRRNSTNVMSCCGFGEMEKDDGDVPVLRSCLASKLRNIDGKILGKDGKPMKAYRTVQFDAGGKKTNCFVDPLVSDARPVENTSSLDMGGDQTSTVKNTFASMLLKQKQKKHVQIAELRNDINGEGAAVAIPIEAVEEVSARFENTLYGYFIGNRLAFPIMENYVKNTWGRFGLKRIMLDEDFFLFQFDTKEGMEKVIESGPWLIRRMPLILNVWTPNSILRKEEIKKAPVWVKLHHVPIVAYSEVGLSLITTQIGCPIMLDSYTSNMCVRSWGRNEYARALIEISADRELMESIVIAIPLGKGKGHTLATIEVEYEWKPPVCSTCKIFDHTNEKCPKLPKVLPTETKDKEGFIEVKKKKNKPKQPKPMEGIRVNKTRPNLHYQRVERGETSNSNGVSKENEVKLKNAFMALNDDVIETNDLGQHSIGIINESDSEDVDEEIVMGEQQVNDVSTNTNGASTPIDM
ncbi:reverse transcriptase domain, reverse transcriptase zinc-binding domain protein, partial [Tanacetum coccineum]